MAIIACVVLVLLFISFRGGDTDYEDYDDEYEEESSPAAGPSGPAPGPSGPAPVEKTVPEIDSSWMTDHRVDEDGTEWAEDENGAWWYRQGDESEWSEWTE
jgi:hypothetical protein